MKLSIHMQYDPVIPRLCVFPPSVSVSVYQNMANTSQSCPVMGYIYIYISPIGFPCGSAGKESTYNVVDLWVQSLAWEDPLEKGKATYSSILVWRIPWPV